MTFEVLHQTWSTVVRPMTCNKIVIDCRSALTLWLLFQSVIQSHLMTAASVLSEDFHLACNCAIAVFVRVHWPVSRHCTLNGLSIIDLLITWWWSSWVRVGVNRYRADRSGHSSFHKLPERDRLIRKSRWWCTHQWDIECLSVWFEFTCAYVC